ncbi:phosphatase PAP2 family protein [Fulvivirgaceae bacterium PWU4]|uniref:Phosphatase PAP2 family protein n=1 Tax=Chryseosolibacter histidini TaxID=2782349 RepID=A0AAP2DGE9_9BACT|nr:phosphatase PAP2 family protein [Chryseosolibacter histidini]MBT1695881.1 phosphatase PAP2 family protein [Chryseosolibacter histidini]
MTHDRIDAGFRKFLITLYLIVFATLLILTVSIEKGADVLLINGLNTPFLDLFFSLFTYVGDGVILVPFIVCACFVRFRDAMMWTSVATLNGLIINLFKHTFFPSSGRPIKLLAPELLHFIAGVEVHSKYSYPSGHTATIFSVITFLALTTGNRRLTLALMAVALLVGYSRIYLLQHFLVDVTGGAMLGCFSAVVVFYLFSLTRNVPAWMNARLEMKIRMPQNTRVIGNR